MITTLIVNYNSTKFVELSLYSLDLLTRNKNRILICDNGSKSFEKKHLRNVAKQYCNVELYFRKQTKKGSVGHAEALDFLMAKVKTPYTVILDADAVFLQKHWDKICIDKINDKVKIIGAPIVENPIKPYDFPLIFATLLETETFRKLNVSFMPKAPAVGLDTGWQLRDKYLKNGYQGIRFEVKNTRYYKNGPYKDVLCAEYYYPNGCIIVSHFGRGSNLGSNKYRKDKGWAYRVPFFKRITLYIRGKREIREWVKISKSIIDRLSA
jgi:hypothetical protein